MNLKNDNDFKLFIFYINLDQTIKNQLIYFPSAKIFTQLLDQCIIIDQRNYTHCKAKQSAKKSFKPQQSDASKSNNNDDNNFKKFNHSNFSSKSTNYNHSFNFNSSFSDQKRKYLSYQQESLSKNEKKRRRNNNLCTYCDSFEHYINNYSYKPQTAINIYPRSSTSDPDSSNLALEYSNPRLSSRK